MDLSCFMAIYALSYMIRNLSGPFDIFDKFRQKMIEVSGPTFYNILNCSWCIGFYCGILVKFLYSFTFNPITLLISGLSGSFVVYALDIVFELIQSLNNKFNMKDDVKSKAKVSKKA